MRVDEVESRIKKGVKSGGGSDEEVPESFLLLGANAEESLSVDERNSGNEAREESEDTSSELFGVSGACSVFFDFRIRFLTASLASPTYLSALSSTLRCAAPTALPTTLAPPLLTCFSTNFCVNL